MTATAKKLKIQVPLDRFVEQLNGQAKAAVEQVRVRVPKANQKVLALKIVGTAPYLQCRFPEKAMRQMEEKQKAGDKAKNKRARAARDFKSDYEQSMHKFANGKCGIPCSAFRAAAISACRLVGFKMTIAKLSIFIEADGLDALDGIGLVEIKGKPELHQMIGRNADGGADIRIRAMWREWSCIVRVRYDADQFDAVDVVNLLDRAGQQVGIGEGRADSRNSAGLGLGFFSVQTAD